jgi:hypothetical protein
MNKLVNISQNQGNLNKDQVKPGAYIDRPMHKDMVKFNAFVRRSGGSTLTCKNKGSLNI